MSISFEAYIAQVRSNDVFRVREPKQSLVVGHHSDERLIPIFSPVRFPYILLLDLSSSEGMNCNEYSSHHSNRVRRESDLDVSAIELPQFLFDFWRVPMPHNFVWTLASLPFRMVTTHGRARACALRADFGVYYYVLFFYDASFDQWRESEY